MREKNITMWGEIAFFLRTPHKICRRRGGRERLDVVTNIRGTCDDARKAAGSASVTGGRRRMGKHRASSAAGPLYTPLPTP